MKTLLPYYSHNGDDITSSRVPGGLERFAQLVYKYIPNVVPVVYTKEDRSKRRVTDIMLKAIEEHRPDIVLSNYSTKSTTLYLQAKTSTPILWLEHTCAGGISSLGQVEDMAKFKALGGHIAMVSDFQWETWAKVARRIHVPEPILTGKINSAFSDGTERVVEAAYDAVTVGRAFPTKNPFWLHSKLYGSGLSSMVLTDYIQNPPAKQQEYLDQNAHWSGKQNTEYSLPYDRVMSTMAMGGTYVSTCVGESWGITALEALCRGLPLILLTNSTKKHASQSIAAHPGHIMTVRPTVKQEDLVQMLKYNRNMSIIQRQDIALATQEKHSLKNWSDNLLYVLERSI